MHPNLSLSVLALALLSSATAAQHTWSVDDKGGGDFTDLPPAIAAAQPGDILVVRAGTYSNAVVSKGLRIVGDPGATAGALFQPMLTVDGVPFGQTLLWRGIGVAGVNRVDVDIKRCRGLVLIEDLSLGGGIQIADSTQVSLHDVAANSTAPPLQVTASTVLLTNCRITGWLSAGAPNHAITVERSNVTMAHTSAVGGLLYSGPSTGSGVHLRSGNLTITGDSATTVAAGGAIVAGAPAPAILPAGGTLTLDPAVRLSSYGGSPLITGPAAVVMRAVPSLIADVQNQQLDATVRANPGETVHLLAGVTLQPSVSLPIGDLWIGTFHAVLDTAVVPPAGTHTTTLAVPPLPPGSIATLQSMVVAGPVVTLSTAVPMSFDG